MSLFHVPEIRCEACVRALNGAVLHLDSNAKLRADLTTRQVRVEATASDEAVAAAFHGAGFTAEPVR